LGSEACYRGRYQERWPEAIDCEESAVQEDPFEEVEGASNSEERGARSARSQSLSVIAWLVRAD
jgi:hypothetical protein